jgi:hypothetical protein
MRHSIRAMMFATTLVATSADAVPRAFEATLSIEAPGRFLTCISNPPPGYGACQWPVWWESTVSGTADVEVTSGGGLVSVALPAGLFDLEGTKDLTYPSTPGVFRGMVLDAGNAAGVFGPTGGTMPLAGMLKICLFAPCSGPPPANISIPLSGIGRATPVVGSGPVNVTTLGAPWTTGTITAGTEMGSFAGSVGASSISLVTPVYVSTNITAMATLGIGYARLSISWVPEPSTALLLGLGCAALIAQARRAQRA